MLFGHCEQNSASLYFDSSMEVLVTFFSFSRWFLAFVAIGFFAQSSTFAWNADGFKMPAKEELKKKLNSMQYKVSQEEGTEPPFKNEYWDNKHDGIYVDIVSGEPLFSSKDKYDSGTGWPSFTKPLSKDNITEKEDRHLFSTRTEVRSKIANSHLGHVFPDGPAPTGLRYCMNSAAMKFIPKEKLKEFGYGEYESQFSGGAIAKSENRNAVAIFAGGCFWCMQPPYDALIGKGVISTSVGYTGGHLDNPTYKDTSAGGTGHREAIEVTYDPSKISYDKLLEIFWMNIDPYDKIGQFCDKGEQYTSAVFFTSDEQKAAYEKSKEALIKAGKLKSAEVATVLLPAKKFYPAEDDHQSYYKKNPIRYKFYRGNCGRDSRLKAVWGSSPH